MNTPTLPQLPIWRLPSDSRKRNPALMQSIVFDEVAKASGFTILQLQSRDRHARIAWARQVALTLLHEFTGLSLAEVGRLVKRDHGTVIYAIKTVKNITGAYLGLSDEIGLIRVSIQARIEYPKNNSKFTVAG